MQPGNTATNAIRASKAFAECATIATEAVDAASKASTALATYANLQSSYTDVLLANSNAITKFTELHLKYQEAIYAALRVNPSASALAKATNMHVALIDPGLIGTHVSSALDTTGNRNFPHPAVGSTVSTVSSNTGEKRLAGHQYTNQPVVNDNLHQRLDAASEMAIKFVSSAVFEGMNNYLPLAPSNSHEAPVSPSVASAATITSSTSAASNNVQPCSSSNHHSQNLTGGSDVLTPSSNSGQAVSRKVKKLCVVCKRVALRGLQYGAIACSSCVAFFYKNLAKNTRAIPNCENGLRCDVTHRGETNRFTSFGYNCRYCRFKKCKEHMDSSKVGKRKRRKF